MKILWFTWKDSEHPLAGGAEVVNQELAKRLLKDGHEVIFLVGSFKDTKTEIIHPDGYKIIRLGNRLTLYWRAYKYYKKNLIGWADLVIDEINTIPFFCKLYVKEPNIVFAHMLCRVIWFYELPQPLSTIGYLIEPLYLKLLKDRTTITVSSSSKQDLIDVGFRTDRIHIISEGTDAPKQNKIPKKNLDRPILLSLGSMRPMKRTLDQLKAFEIARCKIPNLKFYIAGDSSSKYGQKVMNAIKDSQFSKDITYFGKVNRTEKYKLMRESNFIMVTSIKEGWGLVVTEANSQGIPAIVYNVDGLRDSVRNDITGLITHKNSCDELAKSIIYLLKNPTDYQNMQEHAWQWSKQINFDKSYAQFKDIITS